MPRSVTCCTSAAGRSARTNAGEVLEVRGENGAPPYLIRFDDGHESLVFPGTDCVVEHHTT